MFDLLAKSLNTTWDSKAKARAVLKFETALAEASMDRVLRRNPESRNHPMTTKDLPDLTPNFQWTAFISDEHTPSFTKINVGNPDFFKKLMPQNTAGVFSMTRWPSRSAPWLAPPSRSSIRATRPTPPSRC